MKSIVHDLIVKVSSRLVEEIDMGKTKLYLAADYDIYRNTKITAEGVSVPKSLKGVVLYSNNEGFPAYHGKKDAKGKYYPTNHQRSYTTMLDQPIEVKDGDTAYFHYLTLSDNNYLGKDEEGFELYRCGYDNLFCYVREGKIHMVNGWVAVTPLKDEDFDSEKVFD